ncbi:killer cell immunoglobulin-like receptor 2DL4 isoform X2 [Camelus ferus]|uniref:Killer cell immunoglobulin-like receptor 2DL4 isoform X2 n=1 Tax=Camelus ferus TaxID=419612 RepID=A0A8B7KD92_CAMFR|nr:killer cell immunoglobulin-like receptor 2DL4 isoform X2 [Camelus ferus]
MCDSTNGCKVLRTGCTESRLGALEQHSSHHSSVQTPCHLPPCDPPQRRAQGRESVQTCGEERSIWGGRRRFSVKITCSSRRRDGSATPHGSAGVTAQEQTCDRPNESTWLRFKADTTHRTSADTMLGPQSREEAEPVSASCQSGLLLTRGAALRPAGRLGRRIMSVVLPTLLFLGNLPRPRITALPGSVVPSKEPVTILCEGPGHAEAYRISKVGVPEPADRDRQIMPRRTNTLNTTEMTPGFAGLYQCSYQTGGHWSPWSDPLQLVMTGAYEKPSLSSMVGPVVALGEKVKLQCFSNIKFDVFILTGEDGVHSTQNRSSGLLDKGHWAVFPLNRVSSTQAGTYRCYGAFNGDPYVWSFPSDQLQLQVKGIPDHLDHTQPRHSTSLPHSPSFEGKRLGLLIGAPVVAGVLILVLLLFLCCRCKAKNDAARKEGQPEAAGPADGQASEATDPQEVTYSQLTCSVPHQGTAGTPSLPRQTQASEYATLALR